MAAWARLSSLLSWVVGVPEEGLGIVAADQSSTFWRSSMATTAYDGGGMGQHKPRGSVSAAARCCL